MNALHISVDPHIAVLCLARDTGCYGLLLH